ncbi:MAG: molybdopterin-binding protein [Candidatus Limnocylindrales bacterium]
MPHRPPPSPIASAELLAVGAELLAGETRDTNSGDIAGELTSLGVEVARMSQLPDDLAVVTAAVREAMARADLVITTGGLGPTPDDLTRESIAAALGEELSVDPELETWLRELWAARGLPFSKVNLKQAWLIAGAEALANPNGTAPGWWVERERHVVVALPGPPRELQPMWRDQVLPRLRRRGLGLDRAVTTLHLVGIGESALVDLVGADLLEADSPRMATYARADYVDVRISAVATGGRTAQEIVSEAVAGLSPRLDPYVFARDDATWLDTLAPLLGEGSLALAEVGTGGYLGLLLGRAPFVALAEQRPEAFDALTLAADVRHRAEAEIGLAAIAHEKGDDMQVEIGLDIEGVTDSVTHTVFRGGDTGRRRSANVAVAELWRRLRE